MGTLHLSNFRHSHRQRLAHQRLVLISFRLNKGAFDVLTISFPYSVGGASCPADFAQRPTS